LFEESQLFEHPVNSQASVRSDPIEGTLLHRFNRYFVTMGADTPDLVRRAQEIRYQVYCVENAFENPADHPDAREMDKFDRHSVHSLLVHRPTGQAMGTVRLILPHRDAPEESFAIHQLIEHSALEACSIPIQATAEVSRFSISKQFSRTKADMLYGFEDADLSAERNSIERRTGPLMSLGLIQTLVRMSAQHGITYWCAVMEPKLLRMLAAMAIHFRPIGPPVEYHGLRQPCYCHVGTVLDRVKRERPTFWQVLTDVGTAQGCALAA